MERTNENHKVDEEDTELNELLANALQDFDKPVNNPTNSSATPENSTEDAHKAVSSTRPTAQRAPDDVLKPDFPNFEEAFRSFLDPLLQEQMQRLGDSDPTGPSTEEEDAFAASLAETLKGIAENAQSLSENPSEEELAKILGNLGMSGQESDSGSMPNIIPLMQNVMQNLLSKDLLYPALKEIVDKYPDWLAENRGSLEPNKYENYNRQYGLMKGVCDEFAAEENSDSDKTKKERFDRVLQLMQKMQECGHPPKEILGELGSDVQLDASGNIQLPGLPGGDQCTVM